MFRRLSAAAASLVLFAAAAHAAPYPSSGMLLGVYAFPNYQGLRVTGTIPGYAADGVLFRGDVLRRATADGVTIFPTKNHAQIEYAKDQIGPFTPTALEVWRPGVGLIYFWLEFRPVGGAPAAYAAPGAVAADAPVEALIQADEDGSAAALFEGGAAGPGVGGFTPPPGGFAPPSGFGPPSEFGPPSGVPSPGFGDPGALFGN